MLRGPTDLDGQQMFPGTTHGTAATSLMATANTLCVDGQCTGGLPFTLATDWIRLLIKKNPFLDTNALTHEEYVRLFLQSVRVYDYWIGADDPDLRQFYEHGNKMITWHLTNEKAVTVNAAVQCYENVTATDKKRGIRAEYFYRYFEVPGATHCSAPTGAPYPLHALDTLRCWVEEGVSPEELETVILGSVEAYSEVHLPVCALPKVATSNHSGIPMP